MCFPFARSRAPTTTLWSPLTRNRTQWRLSPWPNHTTITSPSCFVLVVIGTMPHNVRIKVEKSNNGVSAQGLTFKNFWKSIHGSCCLCAFSIIIGLTLHNRFWVKSLCFYFFFYFVSFGKSMFFVTKSYVAKWESIIMAFISVLMSVSDSDVVGVFQD